MIRFLDIFISILAMLVVLPFMLLVIVVMLLFQGGPVFFSQIRCGKDFIPFQIYKLRTMRPYAEDESGLTRGLHDERITKTGFFLRKYKIDELPQLLNILKGEMSVVGSRPQVPFYAEKFKDWYGVILTKKPGLLSPAATKFSNEEQLLDQRDEPEKYYEEVLVPVKCKMDIELVSDFGTITYLRVIADYLSKILIKTKNKD